MTDKDNDNGFMIRHPPSATTNPPHPFTLSSFLPQFVNATSHSLPPSPSRLPTAAGFPHQGLRFFTPLGIQSPSTEALALESHRRQRIEDSNNNNIEIHNKKQRLSNDVESAILKTPVQHAMVKPSQQPILGPQPALPCFPLPQTTPIRYPFVPMFAHQPIVPQRFSSLPIPEKIEEEQESKE